jgi:hypothetical protein
VPKQAATTARRRPAPYSNAVTATPAAITAAVTADPTGAFDTRIRIVTTADSPGRAGPDRHRPRDAGRRAAGVAQPPDEPGGGQQRDRRQHRDRVVLVPGLAEQQQRHAAGEPRREERGPRVVAEQPGDGRPAAGHVPAAGRVVGGGPAPPLGGTADRERQPREQQERDGPEVDVPRVGVGELAADPAERLPPPDARMPGSRR